jgi:hypothetical protein
VRYRAPLACLGALVIIATTVALLIMWVDGMDFARFEEQLTPAVLKKDISDFFPHRRSGTLTLYKPSALR